MTLSIFLYFFSSSSTAASLATEVSLQSHLCNIASVAKDLHLKKTSCHHRCEPCNKGSVAIGPLQRSLCCKGSVHLGCFAHRCIGRSRRQTTRAQKIFRLNLIFSHRVISPLLAKRAISTIYPSFILPSNINCIIPSLLLPSKPNRKVVIPNQLVGDIHNHSKVYIRAPS